MAVSGSAAAIGRRPCPASLRHGRGVAVGRGPEAADVLQHPLQADADDTLHRVVADAVLLAVVEDRHDVGVVQLRRRACLGLESPHVGPVGTEPRVHDLQRHPALERLVLGLVDDPHAAAAQLAEQRVVAQPPCDRGRPVRGRAPRRPTGRCHPPAWA